jgi:hypothetical protein
MALTDLASCKSPGGDGQYGLNHGSAFAGLHIESTGELGQSMPHSGEANAASETSAKQGQHVSRYALAMVSNY